MANLNEDGTAKTDAKVDADGNPIVADTTTDESKKNEPKFPANTAPADMTPEQQVEYWKSRSRTNEGRIKEFGDLTPAQVKEIQDKIVADAKAAEDAKPEQEKLVNSAREDGLKAGRQEMLDKFASRMVAAEFKTLSVGRATASQITSYLEDINISGYLNDAGEVDTAKVQSKIDLMFPKGAPKDEADDHKESIGGKRPLGTKDASYNAGVERAKQRYVRH